MNRALRGEKNIICLFLTRRDLSRRVPTQLLTLHLDAARRGTLWNLRFVCISRSGDLHNGSVKGKAEGPGRITCRYLPVPDAIVDSTRSVPLV